MKINTKAVNQAVETARATCPVSDNTPGHTHLRDTIRMEINEETGEVTLIAGDPARGVDYAGDVEFGTPERPAHPFFHFGVETGRVEAQRVAEESKPNR